MNKEAIAGKVLYQKYNCTACHQIYGRGGFLAPDLTTVFSQHGKGDSYIKAFLQTGTQRMPDFHLTKNDINNLSEYLKYIDFTAITYKN